jgi:hypothetical protein
MKKLIAFLITAIIMNSVIAQTTAVNESFETWPAPDWNIYQLSQGGNWLHSSLYGSNLGYGGGNCAKHQISNDNCNNWLVSPQINVISSDYQLTFYEKSTDLQYYSFAGVYISFGSGDPNDGDFIEMTESLQVEGEWVENGVDLSSVQGENIYIAFVYVGTWHHWNVDEVVIAPSTLIDGALTEIVNPTGINPVPGTEDIIVTLHNYGTGNIENADIEWRINDVLQGTYQATGLSLSPGAETNITVGQYNFATQGDYLISLNLLITGDINPSNDLIESIYYVTDPKDAALTKISPEGYSPITGNEDIIVSVLNEGDFTIDDLTVVWEVNNVAQSNYEAGSLGLEPGESIDLVIGQFDFADGLAEIIATVIVSGDEDLSNNTCTSYVAVNMLWESFESEVFPPEMWNADDYPLRDYWFPPPHGEFYYVSQTDNNYFGEISDTLYTPLLHIENGDEITFWVNNSAFFTNNDKLIWKDGTTGEIHDIQNIDSQLENWDEVTIDISGAAGINYIGFVNDNSGSFGTSSLDMITSDAGIYHFDHDLGIRNFHFEYLAKIEEPHTFAVSLRNYGLNQVQGSSYTIKLMTGMGEQLAEQSGVTLQNWEETTIEINYTFSEVEVLKVYAVIDYSSDQMETNNKSVEYTVYSVPADIEVNDVGFSETVDLNIPFNTGGSGMTLGQDDLSQNLFYQNELGIEGHLYGVTLYYHELFGVGQYLPLQVWIKQTDLENLSEGWIPIDEMQMVFNDTIIVYPGHNSVYIPFDEPILITGTNNLAIQYYQYNPEWPYTACRFSSTNANGPVRAIRLNDAYGLDPNDPPNYWGEHTNYTYTSFVFKPISEEGIISGTVYDENNDPVYLALVEVEGTGIEENTDENGEYTLPGLPYETYEITASYLGYNDATQTVIINEPNETADFYLEPLPQVLVFGEVYGSNAPGVPLEGVLVTIDGYDFLSTYTNSDGEFLFENVYGNHEYIITFHLYGYHDYIETLNLEDQDLDLGTIILDEEFISAYNVMATGGSNHSLIEWMDPKTSNKVKLQNDTDIESFSFTNEPFENVWLGNLFENDDHITVTSVEILWDIYENAHDFVTIDILDNEGNVLVSSQPFRTYHDSLMTIDVPNLSIEGDFYAMVHWQDNPISTDALEIDISEDVPNTAYIMYPGEEPILLSDFLGSPNGSFFVRVNTLVEDPERENREVISYNIYRGLAENIDEADTWPALNTEPITGLMFVDETWSNNYPEDYTYAVEAVYEEGNAELTFSNFITGFASVYDMFFWCSEEGSPMGLSGVDVTINGVTITSDFDGLALFEGYVPGDYDYTASKQGYITQTGTVTIIDANIQEFVVMIAGSVVTQTFDLELGYQFISSNVIPSDPDMTVVMADVLNSNLDFVRNSEGQMLRKIGPVWVNGIGDWIIENGYLVKMFSDDSFSIEGMAIDPTTPIPVETGFQFVSYFPANPMDALEAFGSIVGDNLHFIRNSNGQMIRKIGPNWINGIGDAQPGEGYLVKMFNNDEIVYPVAAKSSGKTTIAPSHFIFEGGNAAEPVYTMYIAGLEIGDEVAAYNGDVILGSMSVTSYNVYNNSLPVFSQLTNGQGYVAGEPISLKVWSNDNVVTAEFEMESVYNSYVSDVYPDNDGEFSVVYITKGAIPTEEMVVYPNPATDVINIASPYDISNVTIYNYVGQPVYSWVVNSSNVRVNSNDFKAGIYIIRIQTCRGIETHKVTIK